MENENKITTTESTEVTLPEIRHFYIWDGMNLLNSNGERRYPLFAIGKDGQGHDEIIFNYDILEKFLYGHFDDIEMRIGFGIKTGRDHSTNVYGSFDPDNEVCVHCGTRTLSGVRKKEYPGITDIRTEINIRTEDIPFLKYAYVRILPVVKE